MLPNVLILNNQFKRVNKEEDILYLKNIDFYKIKKEIEKDVKEDI